MTFDPKNANHVLSAALLFMSFMDIMMAKFFFPAVLAKSSQTNPQKIRAICTAMYSASVMFLGLACYFYFFTPLK